MKKVSHNNNWNRGTVQVHVYTPTITPVKGKNGEKLDKYCVTIKLRRDPTSQKLDLYELKTALFDNDEPEEFLLFIRNFNMTRGIRNTCG